MAQVRYVQSKQLSQWSKWDVVMNGVLNKGPVLEENMIVKLCLVGGNFNVWARISSHLATSNNYYTRQSRQQPTMIPSPKCHRPVSEDENAMREGIIVHVMLPSWSTISHFAEVLKRFHAFYVSNRRDMFSKAKATVFTESGQPFCKLELHRKTKTIFLLWHGVKQLPSADLFTMSAVAKRTASKTRPMASCPLSSTSYASSEQTTRNIPQRAVAVASRLETAIHACAKEIGRHSRNESHA